MTGSQFLLRPATPAEIDYIHDLNSAEWGGDLDVGTYHLREKMLASTTACRNGGLSSWVLVNPSENPNKVLSSCETIKKQAFISKPPVNGDLKPEVVEVVAQAIGAVFTPIEHRGKRYAGQMLRLLADTLVKQDDKTFSVLFSDIGKKFYTSLGWEAHPSCHLEYPIMQVDVPSDIKLLHATEVAVLCAQDIATLRADLASTPSTKTRIALHPDFKTHDWHWAREEFLAPILRPKISAKPFAKGAMSNDGKRWVIWTRHFNKNNSQLSILRVVNLSTSTDEENEQAEMAKLLKAAAREAYDWGLERVTIWNPDKLTVRAARTFAPDTAEFVERATASICSLMMHDQGSTTDEVEWVANEKFEWC